MAEILDPTKGFSESNKLQGSSNYLVWSFKAQNIFRKYKCWVTVGVKVPNTISKSTTIVPDPQAVATVALLATATAASSNSTSTIVASSTTATSSATTSGPSSTCIGSARINPTKTKEDQVINSIIIYSTVVVDPLIPIIDAYENDPTELWVELKC